MPVDIQWYCEGLVLYTRVNGAMTSDDVRHYIETIHRLIETSDAPLVHMITDMRGITAYPPLGETMRALKSPERMGWALVIGATESKMITFVTQVLTSALRLRFRNVSSLDEALAFLQKVDSTLPDLKQFRLSSDDPGEIV